MSAPVSSTLTYDDTDSPAFSIESFSGENDQPLNDTDSNGFCVYDFHPPIEAATSILEASSYDNGSHLDHQKEKLYQQSLWLSLAIGVKIPD